MQTISIQIRELDKGGRDLTLQNLRDEIVGFMYRQTVSRATKADMQFYVVLFFVSIPHKDKSALEAILDEGIPKFERFTVALSNKHGYLQAEEYAEMKTAHGLDELFYKDLFFVISSAVLNLDEIESRFSDVISRDKALQEAIQRLKNQYRSQLKLLFDRFKLSRIEDTRVDDEGNTHDLSKSVYRTVIMRSSRNLELNLQRYTSVKIIQSNSPIDLTFLQHIDPNILLHLWDKYNVAHYMASVIKGAGNAAESNLGSGIISGLVTAYIMERRANGAEDRVAKKRAKDELEIEKSKHRKEMDELSARLVKSVLDSNDALKDEIKRLKSDRLAEAKKPRPARDEEVLKSLTSRIARLENLVIKTEVVSAEEDEEQTSLL